MLLAIWIIYLLFVGKHNIVDTPCMLDLTLLRFLRQFGNLSRWAVDCDGLQEIVRTIRNNNLEVCGDYCCTVQIQWVFFSLTGSGVRIFSLDPHPVSAPESRSKKIVQKVLQKLFIRRRLKIMTKEKNHGSGSGLS